MALCLLGAGWLASSLEHQPNVMYPSLIRTPNQHLGISLSKRWPDLCDGAGIGFHVDFGFSM